MSLVPAFKLGLWNAWIFIIPFFIYWVVGVKFMFAPRMPESPSLKKRKIDFISNILVLTMFSSFLYSIFVPF